ncbi:MAG TPA: GDSL-type esterase/lipase family protein [Verrucomicrobiae bacterium]|nr:GDSL-type esterase/lipase family protein [Verrucomicrobiae bacterium]
MKDHQLPFSGSVSRRSFLRNSGVALGAAGLAGIASTAAFAEDSNSTAPVIAKGNVVLFQGDSITDWGRSREKANLPNNQPALGSGYAWLAAADLLVGCPQDDLKIFNRGVSGNKVFQLAARWDKDCLDLKPDVLSILIGVNDIWHTLNGNYNGTVEIYERDYRALIERTLKALPNVKLIICEPYVLRFGAVTDKWFPEFDEYRAAAKRVSDSFKTIFVPFQTMFNEAIKYAPPERWVKDGVHPTQDGASLMAHYWIETVSKNR